MGFLGPQSHGKGYLVIKNLPGVRAKPIFELARRGFAPFLAGVYLLTNVAGLYASEDNFWKERNAASRQRTSPPLLAQLPRGLTTRGAVPELFPPLNSSVPGNPSPIFYRPLVPGAAKQLGWLPGLVAPFGEIREIHLSSRPNAPLIIHLQDAHEIEEAQRNLSGLIEALQSRKKISLVGLEGAVGGFDLDPFRSSPYPDIIRGLADAFLKLGYLTGPEVAGIVASPTSTLWGVEDLSLYREHVEAFASSERLRNQVQDMVANLSMETDAAREKLYSASLRAMDDHRLRHEDHGESLGDYVLALSKSFKGNMAVFPHTSLFLKALTQERTLNFKQVERERLNLVEVLVQRLTPGNLDQVVRESLNYRAGRLAYGDYHRFLLSLCSDKGIPLNGYSQLNAYISYVLLAERIDPSALLTETNDLEELVLDSLATTEEERLLVKVRRGLALLKKLTLHGLTPDEWKAYRTEKDQILAGLETLSHLVGHRVSERAPLTAETLAPFEKFCQRALDRNGAMVKNLLDKMKADQSSSAVFVAGGFHTEGITQILRQEGYSYAVVTPRISRLPETTRPLDIFARAPLPLEKLLAGDVIHLAYARLLQQSREGVEAAGGLERQGTLRVGVVTMLDALAAENTKDRNAPLAHFFKDLTPISKKPLNLKNPVTGYQYKAGVDGKVFDVVLTPKTPDANNFFSQNGFSSDPAVQVDVQVGPTTYQVRIYEGQSSDGAEWMAVKSLEFLRASARAAFALANTAAGYAIRLGGGGLGKTEHKKVNDTVDEQIKKGKAKTLFQARTPQIPGDQSIDLLKGLPGEWNLVQDLRARRNEDLSGKETKKLDQDFDIVVVEGEIPLDVMLHPGYRRRQAYLSLSVLERLSESYLQLNTVEDRGQFLTLLFEGFLHEQEHVRNLGSATTARPSEMHVDRVAPSSRARALLRIAYVQQILSKEGVKKIQPNWAEFLRRSRGPRSSYLHAFMHLTPQEHFEMAERILPVKVKKKGGYKLKRGPEPIEILLAQLHLGAVLNSKDNPDDPLVIKTFDLLESGHAVDVGPETGEPFPLGQFAMDLIRQNGLISDERPLAEINHLINTLDDLLPWERGTESAAGDSVFLPFVEGSTTVLDIEVSQARKVIGGIPTNQLSEEEKEKISRNLRPGEFERGTVISLEDLDRIGNWPFLHQTSVARSVAGKGNRYARRIKTEEGGTTVVDKAKGTYRVPWGPDGQGELRSILEIGIASLAGFNTGESPSFSLDLAVSHFTDKDIIKELENLRYQEHVGLAEQLLRFIKFPELYSPRHFRHSQPGQPKIRVSRVRKAHTLESASGDFYKIDFEGQDGTNERASIFWPDAHDTNLIDYIVDGRAFEDLRQGKRYRFVSNVDNLGAVPTKTLLGIMRLTGAPLINEIAEKPVGEKGGSPAKFKKERLPFQGVFGHQKVMAEEFQFDSELLKSLTPEQIQTYFPLFNAANYLQDVVEFTREAFLAPTATDENVVALLKSFYDERNDRHSLMEKRFRLLFLLRKRTQLFEADKDYPAVQPASLAGTFVGVVPSVFVEVPVGEVGGVQSRLEPMKENYENYEEWLESVTEWISRFGKKVSLKDVTARASDAGQLFSPKEMVLWQEIVLKYKTVSESRNSLGKKIRKESYPTLGETQKTIEGVLARMSESRVRMFKRGGYSFAVSSRGPPQLLNMFAGDTIEKIKGNFLFHFLGIIGLESVIRVGLILGVTVLLMPWLANPLTSLILGALLGGVLGFAYLHKIVNGLVRKVDPQVSKINWKQKLFGSFVTAAIFLAVALLLGLPLDLLLSLSEPVEQMFYLTVFGSGFAAYVAQFMWDATIVFTLPGKAESLLNALYAPKKLPLSPLDPNHPDALVAEIDLALAPHSRLAEDIKGWGTLFLYPERPSFPDDDVLKNFDIEVVGSDQNPIPFLSTTPSESIAVAVKGPASDAEKPLLYIARGAWGEPGSTERQEALEALRWQAQTYTVFKNARTSTSWTESLIWRTARRSPQWFNSIRDGLLEKHHLTLHLPQKFHRRRSIPLTPRVEGDIVHLAMEMDPFKKIGGLADVTSALPRALQHSGAQKSAVILPYHKSIRENVQDGVFSVGGIDYPIETLGRFRPREDMPDMDYVLYATNYFGVPVYFIDLVGWENKPDQDGYFRGDDAPAQAIRFSYCAVNAIEQLKSASRLSPGVIHAHDWHLASSLVFAANREALGNVGRVFSLHNGGETYQGRVYDAQASKTFRWLKQLGLPPELETFDSNGLEFNGILNLMKAGFIMADAVAPVSPQYAREIMANSVFGTGLEGFYRYHQRKIVGTLNGAPLGVSGPTELPPLSRDPIKGIGLAAYDQFITYDKDSLSDKYKNKVALRKQLKLTAKDESSHLHFMVGRFTDQKGLKDVVDATEAVIEQGDQVCLLAVPDQPQDIAVFKELMAAIQMNLDYNIPSDPHRSEEITRLLTLVNENRANIFVNVNFDSVSVPFVLAAADFVWMPSKWEPCGLVQMLAFKFGAIPVVTDVGGLHDTVTDPLEDPETANGFKVQRGDTYVKTLLRAGQMKKDDPKRFVSLQVQGMKHENGWENMLPDFLQIYSFAQSEHRSPRKKETRPPRPLKNPGVFDGHKLTVDQAQAVPLEKREEIEPVLREVLAWIQEKKNSPPFAGFPDGVGERFQAMENEANRLLASSLDILGVFDADDLFRTTKSRGLLLSNLWGAKRSGRLGMSSLFFSPQTVLYPHKFEALLQELWRETLPPSHSEIDDDGLTFRAEFLWEIPSSEVRSLSREALEAHPANGMGRAIRQWRLSDPESLVTAIQDQLENPKGLIDFLVDSNSVLNTETLVPPERLEDQVHVLVADMRRIDGLPTDETPRMNEWRFQKARAMVAEWNEAPFDRAPVESHQAFLKAITDLSGGEEEALIRSVQGSVKENPNLRRIPLINAVLLLAGDVSPDYVQEQELPYQRVYNISAENRVVWGGGLGPVDAFHSDGKTVLLGKKVQNVDIEPDYTHRLVPGGGIEEINGHFAQPIKDLKLVSEFDMPFHGETVSVTVRQGVGAKGNPVFLLGHPKYTKMLYAYNTRENPVSGEEFTSFMSAASLVWVAQLEQDRANVLRDHWRPPILHSNDGQTSQVSVLLSEVGKSSEENPFVSDLVVAHPFLKVLKNGAVRYFTTHTYKNRMYYGWTGAAKQIIGYVSGIINELVQTRLYRREGTYDPRVLSFRGGQWTREWDQTGTFGDLTTAAIQTAHGVNGVSAAHANDVKRNYNWESRVVGVTNGASMDYVAAYFRGLLTRLFQKEVDLNRPTPEQVHAGKSLAKKNFFNGLLNNPEWCDARMAEYFQSLFPTDSPGEVTDDFASRGVIGHAGRLVSEKFNRDRAWVDENISAILEQGDNVVILGGIQKGNQDSEDLRMGLMSLQMSLNHRAFLSGKRMGRLIFLDTYTADLKQQALAAMDILVLDSDEDTEANGYTEVAASAMGALILSPGYVGGEGLIRGQGVSFDPRVYGRGNTLIAKDKSSHAYLDVTNEALHLRKTDPIQFAAHQATSIRLSRVLETNLTCAAYLREYKRAYETPVDVVPAEGQDWIRNPKRVVAGETIDYVTRVGVRTGTSVEKVDARVVYSRVDKFGDDWGDRKTLQLKHLRGGVGKPENGISQIAFHKNLSLPPGKYEFFIETRGSRDLPWVSFEVFGMNHKLEIMEGPKPGNGALSPALMPERIEDFRFLPREPGSIVAWKFLGFSAFLEYFLKQKEKGLSVADLGAGTGDFLRSLSATLMSSHSVYFVNTETSVGVDLFPAAGSSVLQGDASNASDLSRLNINEKSMDLVVINHIDRRGLSMLPNAWNLVQPGGLLLISVAESDVMGGSGDTPSVFNMVLNSLPDSAKDFARVVIMEELGYPEASKEYSPAFLVAVPKRDEIISIDEVRPEINGMNDAEGGRWPFLVKFYNWIGQNWLGQAFMPVLVEWVVPVGGFLWGLSLASVPLTASLLMTVVPVYLLIWHLLHLVGAQGSWVEKFEFPFSKEKRLISIGTLALALLASLYLDFGVSPDVLGAEILGLLSVPHLTENSRLYSPSLRENLLGGPPGSKLGTLSLSIEIDAIRKRVARDRNILDAQRHRMAVTLGLSSDASVRVIAQSLAQKHQTSPIANPDIRAEIEMLLAMAYREGQDVEKDAKRLVDETLRAYHEAQNLLNADEAIAAAIQEEKNIVLEITKTMMSGNPESYSLADRAQWNRLVLLAKAASEGPLKKPVRLLLAEGVQEVDVQKGLSSHGAASLKFVSIPKAELSLKKGTYSLNKFVAWIQVNPAADTGPIDMYLMSRGEWEWNSINESIQKNIRILVDLLPGVVINATNGIAEDILKIIEVSVKA